MEFDMTKENDKEYLISWYNSRIEKLGTKTNEKNN